MSQYLTSSIDSDCYGLSTGFNLEPGVLSYRIKNNDEHATTIQL